MSEFQKLTDLNVKISDLDEEGRRNALAFFDHRALAFNVRADETLRIISKYLFYTNTIGAIVVLGFIGTRDELVSTSGPMWSLFFYLSGLVLTGAFFFSRYYLMANLVNGWKKDLIAFASGDITMLAAVLNYEKRITGGPEKSHRFFFSYSLDLRAIYLSLSALSLDLCFFVYDYSFYPLVRNALMPEQIICRSEFETFMVHLQNK